MSIAEQIHHELESITVAQLPGFARMLGGYNWDKVTFCKDDECLESYVHELHYYIADSTLCKRVQPVFFYGGPTGCLQCRGSLLTFAADRALLASCEKGVRFVRDLMVQMQGEGLGV